MDLPRRSTSSNEPQYSQNGVVYYILKGEEIFDNITNLVQEMQEVIALPGPVIMVLLNHLKWERDHLCDIYYEREDKLLQAANVLVPKSDCADKSLVSGDGHFCGICYCDGSTFGIDCGHQFCKKCWAYYLQIQVRDEGKSLNIACPAWGCSVVVQYNVFMDFVTNEDDQKRYKQLIAKCFVESNKRLRWCPGHGCNKVVSVKDVKWASVTCTCGISFCFLCGNDWHAPVKCSIFKRWLKKCSTDCASVEWIKSNTKDCPKCNTLIEKNGGCNHMTCKSRSCGFEFCWLCLKGTGRAYGSHKCNAFVEVAPTSFVLEDRNTIQRYIHYLDRYANHMNSIELESKLKTSISLKMNQFQNDTNLSWTDVQFFQNAADTLYKCRRTLMYTYCFAYYLNPSNQSEIFEVNQRDLENATESLSGFLETDYSDLGPSMKLEPDEIQRKVLNTTAYCNSRRTKLINHVYEGYDEDIWTFSSTN